MRNPLCFALAALFAGSIASAQSVRVPALRETTPGPTTIGGAIREVAVWVDPGDGGSSLLLTAYDNLNSGLTTFGLDGQQLEQEQDGPALSVSIRDGFVLAGTSQVLAVTANSTNGLSAYVVSPSATDRVRRIGSGSFVVNSTVFTSVALFRGAGSGRFFVFAGTPEGSVQQFELTGADGGVSATLARTPFAVGGAVNGMVADDERNVLYVVQAGEAIWRYSADPDGGSNRLSVASLGQDGGLSNNVDRVALYRAANGEGYLLAADTGAGTFAVIDRRSNALVGSFSVVGNDAGTLGDVDFPRALAVSSQPVGADFPDGLFVAQDSVNGGTDNLKLVRWEAVATAFTPPLRIATQPLETDAGTDGGSDAGRDAGTGGPQQPPGQGGNFPIESDSGCSCTAASVPGSVLLGLLALGLSGRRRRRS